MRYKLNFPLRCFLFFLVLKPICLLYSFLFSPLPAYSVFLKIIKSKLSLFCRKLFSKLHEKNANMCTCQICQMIYNNKTKRYKRAGFELLCLNAGNIISIITSWEYFCFLKEMFISLYFYTKHLNFLRCNIKMLKSLDFSTI